MTASLFRIEMANRNRLTNPSKTSVWTVPADKTALQTKQISEMVWKASKLNKGSCFIDFPHRSVAKISYLITHHMKMSGIHSFPFNVEKSEFLALALIVKEDLAKTTFKICVTFC